jgi:protoporphyrinogen oxidase
VTSDDTVDAFEIRPKVVCVETVPIAIVGAGLSGLSTSYHLGHPAGAVIFEAKSHYGGHIHSEYRDGFTWDDGPHISFTSNEYVKSLFSECVAGDYIDLYITATNWFEGNWIDHPAQTSLWQVPEPLRSQCVASFLEAIDKPPSTPSNYQEWLDQAMGPVFAENFPAKYTRKYWTLEPRQLDVDWIGSRVLRPERDDVIRGSQGPLPQSMYYVNTRSARYPTKGGFWAYAHKLADGAQIAYNRLLQRVDLKKRILSFSDGSTVNYERLVTTTNLRDFIAMSEDVPADVQDAAQRLLSSQFWRIDVAVGHEARRPELWFYVYDEDKLSVRMSRTEAFAVSNAPEGKTGIQVEVYGSVYKPLPPNGAQVAATVVDELIEFGLVDSPEAIESVAVKRVNTGQIIYDLQRREALSTVNEFLTKHGVERAGRYAEWKYLMTDACTLSGRRVASRLTGKDDRIDWSGVAITKDDVPED